MCSGRFFIGLTRAIAVLAVLGAAAFAAAQTEAVVYQFPANTFSGLAPNGVLISDAAGNLYGTTQNGGTGSDAYGTVFELTPGAGGVWTETILHTFTKNDGRYPYAGVVFDSAGNLYGTTYYGGAYGYGTVFELLPGAGGTWTEKILHSFNYNGTDGLYVSAGVILDDAGNIYGTTNQGGSATCSGADGCGTVFELMPTTGGGWKEKILHNFTGGATDGWFPYAGLIFDVAGNLYGTTGGGGTYNYGTVFELAHTAGGSWTERVLHNFDKNGSDGIDPLASLIIDAAGNLYGTTLEGGSSVSCPDGDYGCGTVFELAVTSGGGYRERILHSFVNNGQDGYYPYASLLFDASGNLYGTASTGGGVNDSTYGGGTVFQLEPAAGGRWTERTLHSFGSGTDGQYPQSGLTLGSSGTLYGSTPFGGSGGNGIVFEIPR